MKKEIKSTTTKTENKGIDASELGIIITGLMAVPSMILPNVSINLGQIANSMTGLGCALMTGAVAYLSLSLIKDIVPSKNENEIKNSGDKR